MTARYRFGGVEFDPATGALEPLGKRLAPQPARLLELLACRGGAVASRREIRDTLWSDTNIEFDKSLHFCVHQVRTALGDSASEPRFVETIPRQGYRLMPEVERVEGANAEVGAEVGTEVGAEVGAGVGAGALDPAAASEGANPAQAPALSVAARAEESAAGQPRRRLLFPVSLGVALALVAAFMANLLLTAKADDRNSDQVPGRNANAPIALGDRTPVEPGLLRIGVMPFEPPADWSQSSVPNIAEWILEDLTIAGKNRAWIVGPSTTSAYTARALSELAADYDLDYIVNGRFLGGAEPPAMLAELIRTSDGAHIWVERVEQLDDGRRLGRMISVAVGEHLLGPSMQ